MTNLRVVFSGHVHEIPAITSAIDLWSKAMSSLLPGGFPTCVFISYPISRGTPRLGTGLSACVHLLPLKDSIDRYIRESISIIEWNPWGRKSGPNFQFFELLNELSTAHPEDWILQLESDTFPLRELSSSDFQWIDGSNVQTWVRGAVPHPRVAGRLNSNSRSHINGAAFYRVGNRAFIDFLNYIWKPSLIQAAIRYENIAYDVLTSRQIERVIGGGKLAGDWTAHQARFTKEPGMVNLSGYNPKIPLERALSEGFRAGTNSESPWLIHSPHYFKESQQSIFALD